MRSRLCFPQASRLIGEKELLNTEPAEARQTVWMPALVRDVCGSIGSGLTESLLRYREKLPRRFRNYRVGVGEGGCGQ